MSYVTIVKTKYKVYKIGLGMLTYDETFRQGRKNLHLKKLSSCHRCNRKFKDGEEFSLAVTDKGNKVICNECAEQLASENSEIEIY